MKYFFYKDFDSENTSSCNIFEQIGLLSKKDLQCTQEMIRKTVSIDGEDIVPLEYMNCDVLSQDD